MLVHYHTDEKGFLHKCYHKSRSVLTNWKFYAVQLFIFPIEHFVWMQIPGLRIIGHYIMKG